MAMKFGSLYILIIVLVSCNTYKQAQNDDLKRIVECRKSILDSNIQVNTQVKVILFDEQMYYDVAFYPALVIGITSENDTIGIVDSSFKDKLFLNQLIWIYPDTSNILRTDGLRPLLSVSKDRSRNNLYCSIKVLYKGKIKIE